MIGRSVTFGPKSVEKRFQRGTLNLTTPNEENKERMIFALTVN